MGEVDTLSVEDAMHRLDYLNFKTASAMVSTMACYKDSWAKI